MATTVYSFETPVVGGSDNTWGTMLNSNWAKLDSLIAAAFSNPTPENGFGVIRLSNLPEIPASKVTSGQFSPARIPNLNADKINDGVFALARIPNLPASRVTEGTFHLDRIPTLPNDKLPADINRTSVQVATGANYSAPALRFGDDTGFVSPSDRSNIETVVGGAARFRVTQSNVEVRGGAKFLGDGEGLTNLSAAAIARDTIAVARLPVLPISKGGTGATSAANARSGLGLGTMAVRNYGQDGDQHRTNAQNDSRYFIKGTNKIAVSDLAADAKPIGSSHMGQVSWWGHGVVHQNTTNRLQIFLITVNRPGGGDHTIWQVSPDGSSWEEQSITSGDTVGSEYRGTAILFVPPGWYCRSASRSPSIRSVYLIS